MTRFPIALAAALMLTSAPSHAEVEQTHAAWFACVYHAADVFARLDEPAQAIVLAAFGSCYNEEVAVDKYLSAETSYPLSNIQEGTRLFKTETLGPGLLARILATRAIQPKTAGQPRYLVQ